MKCEDFWELVDLMKESDTDHFDRWKGNDAFGRRSSPIELLLLGTLRYLGRGWTFDDIEEATAISEDVHRVFFHRFIAWGSTVLYTKYVRSPATTDEVASHRREFNMAGFDGAIRSTDATHILCFIDYKRANLHKGFKLCGTARTYNMTVNHRRRILFTTHGHPSRWNDKTLQIFDEFMRGIMEGGGVSDERCRV